VSSIVPEPLRSYTRDDVAGQTNIWVSHNWAKAFGSPGVSCVELRGFEPLTYSMRTSRLWRLSWLMALAPRENRRPAGWNRWRVYAVA
jgi:hypothetical protein